MTTSFTTALASVTEITVSNATSALTMPRIAVYNPSNGSLTYTTVPLVPVGTTETVALGFALISPYWLAYPGFEASKNGLDTSILFFRRVTPG